ncbi:MAG: antitoxin [Pseudonocardia sp.]|nr:antitoxin [Pseudonocardia sp.]
MDKLGDLADQKTGGKYSGQIDKGEEIIKQRLGEQGPTEQGPTKQGPTEQGAAQ